MIEYLLGQVRALCCVIGVMMILGTLVACGEDPQQLFETAQFEEQQHNQVHAKELYQRILRDHEDSPLAKEAEARLKELGKGIQ